MPLADGTLVATAEVPSVELVPGLLATSDVFGTGWYAADAADVREGLMVVVVGDGAVGLMGVLSAKEMGSERIIAMSCHASRQALALAYGATDIVAERGEEGIARVKELTGGVGADLVLECVGLPELMKQAIDCARPGGSIGYVGVPHGITFDGKELFFAQKRLLGGPAPVRRFLPSDESRPVRQDRSGQSVRSGAAALRSCRGLPGHGRTARHQDLAPGLVAHRLWWQRWLKGRSGSSRPFGAHCLLGYHAEVYLQHRATSRPHYAIHRVEEFSRAGCRLSESRGISRFGLHF